MSVVPRFRLGIDELVHVVALIDRSTNGNDYWTPMCQPYETWIALKDSTSEGPPTCLWCVTHSRFR